MKPIFAGYYRSCCLRIGTYIVIDKILEEYKLMEMLKKYLGNDYGVIMDLMTYLIVDEENAGQYYPNRNRKTVSG